MRNYIPRLVTTAAIVLAIASLGTFASSHGFTDKMIEGKLVGGALTAVSTDTAMIVRYVGGASGGGEIAVAAGGDITLTLATVADATTECPVSGAYGGVIDVSDASCNTMGEVCDAINFSDNWRCTLVGALRTDSSNNTLVTISATDADTAAGLELKTDTAVALKMDVAFVPVTNDIREYLGNDAIPPAINPNPFKDHRTALYYYTENVTTSGAATISCYGVTPKYAKGALNTAGTGFTGGAETVRTLFSVAGGATTVEKVMDFRSSPLITERGEKLLCRTAATTDLTVPIISGIGSYFVP